MTDYQLSTLAIRAGQVRTHEGEHSEPIFPTSSYVFRNAAEAAARFAETEKGNIYSRFTNPTVRCFEERLAAMEGGAACVGTGSGMAAILATCMALLKAGDHIVCSDSVFGSTIALINRYLVKFGVEVTYVRPDDNDAWRAAITSQHAPVLPRDAVQSAVGHRRHPRDCRHRARARRAARRRQLFLHAGAAEAVRSSAPIS